MTLVHDRFGAAIVVVAGLFFIGPSAAGETVADLALMTHVHGIAVDRGDPSRLMLATHHGFYAVTSTGDVEQVSETGDDFMGFTAHPTDPSILYASGHPERGGNLGFIVSGDGGRSWSQVSEGAGGPVDFHSMDVSKSDPDVIYGSFRGLQVSRDGGRTWEIAGPGPARLIDLAASAMDPDTVYAATEAGLQVSRDAGRSWQPTEVAGQPVSLVEVSEDGRILAFVVGLGLLQGKEGSPEWETLNAEFGGRILLHLAIDPLEPERIYAVTLNSEVLASADGGKTWRPFGSDRQ